MKLQLTKAQMLKRRRLAAGLEPVRTDCTIERTDGLDVDALLLDGLRKWYVDLLANGPRHLLAEENIAEGIMLRGSASGASMLVLPSVCVRVFEVKLEGWARTAEVLPADMADTIHRRQRNPYTAATADHPVALAGVADTGEPCILAWPPAGRPLLVSAVTDEGENIYKLDEASLATMPTDAVPEINF